VLVDVVVVDLVVELQVLVLLPASENTAMTVAGLICPSQQEYVVSVIEGWVRLLELGVKISPETIQLTNEAPLEYAFAVKDVPQAKALYPVGVTVPDPSVERVT